MATPLAGMFESPTPQRGTRETLSRALSGFGAGVQGRGPEYTAMLQQQDQQLDMQRQKAMAQDAMQVYNMLGTGKYDDAIGLIDRRVKAISELGGDPSDTLEIRQMITSGQIPEATQELEGFLGQAMQYGLIEPPAAPELVSGSNVINGQVVERDAMGNTRARRVEGLEQAPEQAPGAFQSLQLRAQAAGLQPGTPEYQQFMAQGGSSQAEPRVREREARIQEYMEGFGMTRQDAIRALDSRTMLDDRGNLIQFDPTNSSGSLVDVDVGGAPPRPSAPPPRVTEEDLAFDPGKGTGFGAAFVGAYNSTFGQIPILPTIKGPEQAAQQLRVLERDAINALATSSRPAVVEQQRIIAAIPKAMEWTENPDVARSKMTSFIDLMTNQYVDDLRYQQDRRNPRSLRDEAGRRAGEVERIMNRVLTPEAAGQMFNSINRVEQEIGDITTMSIDDLLSADPSTLTDAQLEAMERRLRDGGN